jgi:hypothetical protein
MTKQCVTCLVVHPLSNYYKRGTRLYTSCKTCEGKKRQLHYSANKDRINKKKRDNYKKDENVSNKYKEWTRKRRANRTKEEQERDKIKMKEYDTNNKERRKQLNSKHREIHRNNFVGVINSIIKKKGGACKDCGNTDMRVLEFDHINQEDKSFEVTFRHSLKAEAIEKEAEKTELVCLNCHRLRSARQYTRNSRNAKKSTKIKQNSIDQSAKRVD